MIHVISIYRYKYYSYLYVYDIYVIHILYDIYRIYYMYRIQVNDWNSAILGQRTPSAVVIETHFDMVVMRVRIILSHVPLFLLMLKIYC